MFKQGRLWAALLLLVFQPTYACSAPRYPIIQVEVCIFSPGEELAFLAFMRDVAQRHEIPFTDRSSVTEEELRQLAPSTNPRPPIVVHAYFRRADGLGASFSNGLLNPEVGVVVGFSRGYNELESLEFANQIIDEIAARWTVVRLPSGQGALGDACLAETGTHTLSER